MLKKIFGRVVLGMTVFAVMFWGVDWAIWRARVADGGGMGAVEVTRFQVAELKGGREQMYPEGDGPEPEACSISVFPHGGAQPCWYVVKHPVVFDR